MGEFSLNVLAVVTKGGGGLHWENLNCQLTGRS